MGPIPFRFIPQWIEQEGFMEVVAKSCSTLITEPPSYVWEQKLRNAKSALKEWIKFPIPSPTIARKENIEELSAFQISMEDQEISNSHLVQEHLTQIKTTLSFREEEEHLQLKSRCLWLKAGDKNSAFFHKQCRVKLSQNHISEITHMRGFL